MADKYDILVAGGGHNSLICAAYLARAGLRVLVLEAGGIPGGNAITEEMILPGYQFDACSSAHVLFQSSPTLRNNELHLDKYGLRYLFPDPVVTLPFDDGENLTMWRDINRTAEEIARFSAHDARAYRQLIADYEAVKKIFGNYRYTPIGYGPTLDEALTALPDGAIWQRRNRQSALKIITDYFEEEHVRAFMLWLAFLTSQPIDEPYTGIQAYAIAYGRQSNGWATPAGGSGALPKALVALIEDHGGRVLTGKQVVELLLEDGRCVGARTSGGEAYYAEKAVVSTIHIKHLVEMAPRAIWGEMFAQGVEQWQPGFTYFVAHYALTEPPLYPIGGQRLPCVAAGTANSVDNLLRLMSDMRRGVIHQDTPVLLAVCSSVVDASRAPAGKHTLKVMSVFPYDLKEGVPSRWDEIKEDVARRNLDYLRSLTPNLTDAVILGQQVESPLDLERRNLSNWRGSCHGGEASPAQSGVMRPVPGWASHRMPIPGLYQTGSTTHPGGSVSGAPGRNAAWVILDDLEYSLKGAIGGEKNNA
ncbi:MAG: NAD(P)/FAD-dependent oxidoreductase [Chloroflexi bacterium]|nr:NAD(P)/FAD-dependent oxidoreductase [Chloroflexota bacterium]